MSAERNLDAKRSRRTRVRMAQQPAPVDPCWAAELVERLLPWFQRHQRDLPWRKSKDPYRVWISEIMLQQTQVATVIPYFERFMKALPDVRRLAAAEEQEVLRLWEGLGYYRRARQLHAAAQVIASEHGGEFPRAFEEILALPGVGRYTAGAIASIAYGQRQPILEANTTRLLARLFAVEGDLTSTGNRARLWELAAAILPRRHCGAFNQALMELGSLVCTPQRPSCQACPASELCAAYQQGRQDELPAASAKTKFEQVREAAVVVWRKDRVFVRRRGEGERWAGLWDFVRFPLTARRGPRLAEELADKVREQAGIDIAEPRRIATLKHGVTRFRITLECYAATCQRAPRATTPQDCRWLAPAELGELPLSTTGRKLSRLLAEAT